MISQQTIDKVEEKAEIVAVIGDYLSLKKKGSTWEAPCPFHGEKTASFKVSASKGIYKCFGCGVGGNAVRFVMEHEKITYPEAIKHLAKKYNVEFIELEVDEKQREIDMARDSIFTINEFAALKFQENLKVNTGSAQIYVQSRNLKDEILQKFGIGYATPGYRDLYDYLIANKYSHENAVASNLVTVGEDSGKTIDKFRDRLIFPIHNISGRIVGFGGRILTNDKSVAKYVNTSDTQVYHKRNIVYGLYQAKKAISDLDNCLMVEGYMDVISPFQHGIENICAVSGTSLTIEQIRQIKKFTKNITFLYDGDAAGLKAASRSMELAIQEGMNIRVVAFEKDVDPDSLINKVGPVEFRKYIDDNKLDIIDFYLRDWKTLSPEKRDETTKIILGLIARIPFNETFTIKSHTEKMARLLEISVTSLQSMLSLARLGLELPTTFQPQQKDDNGLNHELEFVKALILYGDETFDGNKKCFYYMIERCGLPEKFKMDLARNIIYSYMEQLENGKIPNLQFFIDHEEADVSDFATQIEFFSDNLSKLWENQSNGSQKSNPVAIVKNVTSFLRIYKFKEMISDISARLKTATEESEIEELFKQDDHFKKQLSMECQLNGINLI